MKTASIVAAICLVGALLSIGAHFRADRVRSAYRIRGLNETLSLVRNENHWLRGDIERKRNPRVLERTLGRRGAAGLVQAPVVEVVPGVHGEVPGL